MLTTTRLRIIKTGVIVMLAILWSSPAKAQLASAITGVVRDTSGAVLPGVTVEASSPALIEKVRTTITDGEGRYSITELRIGTYTVTFTLTGFSTVRREGLELVGGFTATVNADMRVGSLEETLVVTGAALLVDVQNVRQRNAASDELLAALPTGMKMFSAIMTLTAGISPPNSAVSGSGTSGIYQSSRAFDATYHGKTRNITKFDGMNISSSYSSSGTGYFMNAANAEEMTVETSGGNAESNSVGVIYDVIPKEGGNLFSGFTSGLFTQDALQGDNLTDELRARGLTRPAQMDFFYDINGAFGGPIKQDRLWFFTSGRRSEAKSFFSDVFFNSTHGTPVYTPDTARPGFTEDDFKSIAVRLTWQAAQKHKVNVFGEFARGCTCPNIGSNTSAEALVDFLFSPHRLIQATWTNPATNRLLFEAGVSAMTFDFSNFDDSQEGAFTVPILGQLLPVSILNQATGQRFNSQGPGAPTGARHYIPRWAQRFSMSYITGSHQFKTGMTAEQGVHRIRTFSNDPFVAFNFIGTAPASLDQFTKPYAYEQWLLPDLGLFAQDQWTYRRLTLNLGLRFDWFRGSIPEQDVPANPFVSARHYAAVDDVPNWKNINPRFALSYDLFGDSRTALKISFGRYNGPNGAYSTGIAHANNPVITSVQQVNRVWNDANGDYIPDCDLVNPLQNGECGQISDLNFGQANPRATVYADDVLRGWKARDYSWDFSARVEHQIGTGISLSAGYFRNTASGVQRTGQLAGERGELGTVTRNLAVTPEDYTSYCITAPTDPRLPGGGGYPVCGLADVSPAKVGQVSNVVTQASNFGDETDVGDWMNFNVNARLSSTFQMGGGMDTGRHVSDTCFVVNSPQDLFNCHVVRPFRSNTQLKMFWSYELPAAILFSGTLQNMPGPAIQANYQAPNAVVAPSLGRNLAACGTRVPCNAVATIALLEPFTEFEGRRTQLNLRVGKIFRLSSKVRLQTSADLFNALNRADILAVNSTFGAAYRRPTSILEARTLQFSADLRF